MSDKSIEKIRELLKSRYAIEFISDQTVLDVIQIVCEGMRPFGYWVEHRTGEYPMMIHYGSFVPASDHYKVTTLFTHPALQAEQEKK